jgi:hypothetical protein
MIQAMLFLLVGQLTGSNSQDEIDFLVFGRGYMLFSYVLVLQGSKGFLVDLEGCLHHAASEPRLLELDHIMSVLLGKVMGEQHT